MMIQSPKFKRVSLDETPEFPFWGLNIVIKEIRKNGEYE